MVPWKCGAGEPEYQQDGRPSPAGTPQSLALAGSLPHSILHWAALGRAEQGSPQERGGSLCPWCWCRVSALKASSRAPGMDLLLGVQPSFWLGALRESQINKGPAQRIKVTAELAAPETKHGERGSREGYSSVKCTGTGPSVSSSRLRGLPSGRARHPHLQNRRRPQHLSLHQEGVRRDQSGQRGLGTLPCASGLGRGPWGVFYSGVSRPLFFPVVPL